MAKAKTRGLEQRAFRMTRSLIRLFSSDRAPAPPPRLPKQCGIKVAFIHNEKRFHSGIHTGAAQINQLMALALSARGVCVRNFYPRTQLTGAPDHLRGIASILFFYSLLEHKEMILKHDIIQGTTYTPLPFLPFHKPVVCHFGSTVRGYLDSTPLTKGLPKTNKLLFRDLHKLGIIRELDFSTFRPLEDIADVETLAASRASACIATSEKVRRELMAMGIPDKDIRVIHNAIEDYWFNLPRPATIQPPHLVFLGRLGGDVFTLKLIFA